MDLIVICRDRHDHTDVQGSVYIARYTVRLGMWCLCGTKLIISYLMFLQPYRKSFVGFEL